MDQLNCSFATEIKMSDGTVLDREALSALMLKLDGLTDIAEGRVWEEGCASCGDNERSASKLIHSSGYTTHRTDQRNGILRIRNALATVLHLAYRNTNDWHYRKTYKTNDDGILVPQEANTT